MSPSPITHVPAISSRPVSWPPEPPPRPQKLEHEVVHFPSVSTSLPRTRSLTSPLNCFSKPLECLAGIPNQHPARERERQREAERASVQGTQATASLPASQPLLPAVLLVSTPRLAGCGWSGLLQPRLRFVPPLALGSLFLSPGKPLLRCLCLCLSCCGCFLWCVSVSLSFFVRPSLRASLSCLFFFFFFCIFI